MSRFVFSRFARYFEEVARLGSIRRAAEELNVSASAIDRQLLLAEEEFGVALFERLPRGVRLTAAGEILIYGFRRWQQDLSRIKFEIEELRGLRRGEVKLAVVEEATFDFVPNALASFMQDHPRINLHVTVAEPDRIRQLVLDGQADFGLAFDPQVTPALRIERQARFRFGALVPRDHKLAGQREISFSHCAQYPLIIPDSIGYLREAIEKLALRAKVLLKPMLTANNLSFIRLMVAQGRGIGFVTSLGAEADAKAPGFSYAELSDRGISPASLTLFAAAERQLSAASILALRYFAVYFDDLDRLTARRR
ncbi:MAG: hypothetical protein BGP04_20375 [Rhizobiales bacterium 62-17]|nr:LysR family transcriptional regulator [Hyphomicrobiales bacterium]OJX99990.1 MAG: hypothetical protein BGP04_20375 [Rhizobiales bacterium 62-17]